MQVAQRIGGYSLGQADMLRRAMSKKKADVLAAERVPFVAGAQKAGFTADLANKVYDILIPFAEYGFNKSHAAAYSVVAYRTAYLKANFPAEYMAANLTNEIANQDKLQQYIIEARKMGITISPPDVNRSERYFTVVDGKIVYGLIGLKGVGAGAVDEIVKARSEGGPEGAKPFADFIDFLERVDLKAVNRKVIEVMIQAGCFDSLGRGRACLMNNFEAAAAYAQHKKDARKYGQTSLFEACVEEEFPDYAFAEVPEYPRSAMLDMEKELLGFYFSGHPLDDFRQAWERCVDLDLSQPGRSSPDKTYTVLGMIKDWHEIITKTGKKMAFAGLDDFSGSIELVIFADVLEKYRARLEGGKVVALKGKVDLSRGEPAFKVEEVADPEGLREKAIREVHIRLTARDGTAEDDMIAIRDLILGSSGACQVYFHLMRGERETIVKAAAQIGVSPSEEVADRLRLLPSVTDVWKE